MTCLNFNITFCRVWRRQNSRRNRRRKSRRNMCCSLKNVTNYIIGLRFLSNTNLTRTCLQKKNKLTISSIIIESKRKKYFPTTISTASSLYKTSRPHARRLYRMYLILGKIISAGMCLLPKLFNDYLLIWILILLFE